MSLRVMLFVGCMILVLGHFMSRLTPMTTSQEKLIPPAGTSTVNHGDYGLYLPCDVPPGPSRCDRFT